MSRTRVWLPNEIARPNTEAPAIKGVILTSRLVSIVSVAVMTMMVPPAMRRMGASVSRRVPLTVTAAQYATPQVTLGVRRFRGLAAEHDHPRHAKNAHKGDDRPRGHDRCSDTKRSRPLAG